MASGLKIAVIGAGGVGGFVCSMLASHLPGVTVVARGDRGRAISERGLVLHSDYKGEITAHPAVVPSVPDLGNGDAMDVIFICVKNYSLEQVLDELRHGKDGHPVIRNGTILVPVMNGVDPGQRVRAALPGCRVIDSVIYIVAYADADYSIRQEGNFASMRIGTAQEGNEIAEAVRTVESILKEADIDFRTARDIEAAIWEKYILNAAFNVCTAAYDCNIGPLRDDPDKAADYEAAIREACALARAKGVGIREDYEANMLNRFYNVLLDTDSSSLQRDVHAGKKSEVETFCGYSVREGKRLGVPMPVMEKMYQLLKDREAII